MIADTQVDNSSDINSSKSISTLCYSDKNLSIDGSTGDCPMSLFISWPADSHHTTLSHLTLSWPNHSCWASCRIWNYSFMRCVHWFWWILCTLHTCCIACAVSHALYRMHCIACTVAHVLGSWKWIMLPLSVLRFQARFFSDQWASSHNPPQIWWKEEHLTINQVAYSRDQPYQAKYDISITCPGWGFLVVVNNPQS